MPLQPDSSPDSVFRTNQSLIRTIVKANTHPPPTTPPTSTAHHHHPTHPQRDRQALFKCKSTTERGIRDTHRGLPLSRLCNLRSLLPSLEVAAVSEATRRQEGSPFHDSQEITQLANCISNIQIQSETILWKSVAGHQSKWILRDVAAISQRFFPRVGHRLSLVFAFVLSLSRLYNNPSFPTLGHSR